MGHTARFVALVFVIAANACSSSGGGSSTGKGGSGGGSAGAGGSGSGGSTGNGGATGNGGSTGNGGATGSGGSGATDGGADALAACGTRTDPNRGESCNNVVPTGPCVTPTMGTGSPPAATGGQVQAGTYELVSRTVYAADSGSQGTEEPRRQTFVITGTGNTLTVQIGQISGTTLERQTASAMLSGTQLTHTETCPPPDDSGDNSGTIPYSATATSLTVVEMGGNGQTRVDVFMKR
jgi:hypothetical protein